MHNKKVKDSPRFKTSYKQRSLLDDAPYCDIIVDTVTGVNYLISTSENSFGTSITPLLDKDGKIVVAPTEL